MKPSGRLRLLVSNALPDVVSGAERAIVDTLRGCADRIEPVMWTPGPGRLSAFYEAQGLSVAPRAVSWPRRLYPGLHSLQSWQAARALKPLGPRAVLANTFAAASRSATAARLMGLPQIVYVREYMSDRPSHRRTLAEAALVLAVSADVAGHVRRLAPRARVQVCHDHFTPPAVRAGPPPLPGDGPAVVLVGRVTPYKRQDLFIRAAGRVLQRVPEARFYLAGSASPRDGAYEAECRRLAAEPALAGRVTMLGDRDDVPALLARASVACMVSDREPYPRVILEAQALGCPIVASCSGGAPDMVEHGVDGLLIPAEPAAQAEAALADALVRLLSDASLRAALAVGGRARIAARDAAERAAERFADLVLDVVRAPARPQEAGA